MAVGLVLMLPRLILRLIWLMQKTCFVSLLLSPPMMLMLVLLMLRLCLVISLSIFRLLENRLLGLNSNWRYVTPSEHSYSVMLVNRRLLSLILILLMMNRFVNLVVRDAPLECPFQIQDKRIAPAVVAAIVAGVSSLLGSGVNAMSQSSANSTNLDIARMNAESQRQTNESNAEIARQANATNLAMLREQNAFNLDMWNKQNEYNSPSHMVEMLKKAGLNPAFMYGQPTPASSLTSVEAKPAEKSFNVAPQLDYQQNPVRYGDMFDSVGTAINAYYQNQLLSNEASKSKSQTVGFDIQNDKERRTMEDVIAKLRNEAKGSGYQAESAKRILDFYNLSFDTRLRMVQGDAMLQEKNLQLLSNQIDGIQLDNQLKRIEVLYRPRLNDKELQQLDTTISQIRAQIGLISANTFLTQEQALHEIEKKVGTIIDNGMKSVDSDIKSELKQTVIRDAVNQSEMLDFNRRNQKVLTRAKMVSGFIPFASGIQKMGL